MDNDPRAFDPGRGPFCAVTKSGNPLPFPPNKRTPRNRGGVFRPGKTYQDAQPVEQRERVQDARRRGGV